MSALSFPCTIFTTKNRMDDFGAKDMHCGDLSAEQLKKDFGLSIVSDRVDPWTLERKKHQQVSTYPASSSGRQSQLANRSASISCLMSSVRAQKRSLFTDRIKIILSR